MVKASCRVIHRRVVGADFFGGCRQPLGQCRHRLAQQRAGALALVHQALDQAQVLDLLGRIDAFAERIAQGLREAVAPLPDAQGVLAESGVALDGGNADSVHWGLRNYRLGVVHEIILCPRQNG